VAVVVVGLAMLPTAASAGTGPGTWTQADINASIDKALAYLDTQQNPDGSYGTSDPGAESALALGAYGVKGYANLPPAEQTQVQNGIKYLLSTQQPDGSFAGDGFFLTYDTGTALIALSLLGDVPTTPAGAIPTAIASARSTSSAPRTLRHRSVVINRAEWQRARGAEFLRRLDYGAPGSRSDESNTGFALTGLELTGGVPTDVASIDVGWQQNVQQLTSNPGGFFGPQRRRRSL